MNNNHTSAGYAGLCTLFRISPVREFLDTMLYGKLCTTMHYAHPREKYGIFGEGTA